jgi:RND family efflux transporter MFP subunit
MSSRLIVGAAVLGALALAWMMRSPAMSVDTSAVSRGPLSLRVTTNGKVEPVEEVEVRARLDGRILEIPEPGTRVAEGDVILSIDGGSVGSQLAKARSERLSARESLRSARAKLDREKERAAIDERLFNEGAITGDRHAESQSALREARSRVSFLQREVPLRVASLDLLIQELESQQGAAELKAPFAGTVYRSDRRRGEMVHVGDPILRIADLERLRVRANVDQVDLGRVRPDQKVRISSNAFPGRTWIGTVSEVIPHVVVRESRSISESLARVEPPTEGLVPGMSVDVEIVVAQSADALQIPAAAVVRGNGNAWVFRIQGNRAERTPVSLGLETVSAVEVTEGLEADDQVVLGPLHGLTDGARVEARLRDAGEHN